MREEFRKLGKAAKEGLTEYRAALEGLVDQRVEHESEEGAIQATVDLTGRLTDFRLRPDALRHTDRITLAEQIVATIKGAQEKAVDSYEEELARITPESLRTYDSWLRRNLR